MAAFLEERPFEREVSVYDNSENALAAPEEDCRRQSALIIASGDVAGGPDEENLMLCHGAVSAQA